MSFLTPLFLLGAFAVGLPVVFHLIRRTTRERKPFSSLMFLQPSPPRLTRRSRLEHILLLVLRCAVICLLAAGFARPYFKHSLPPPAHPTARRLLLLLDTSASMRRSGLWPVARSRAEAIVRQTSPADQVAVFTFDRQLNPVMTFDQWSSASPGERAGLASARISAISPGWSDTHLGSALTHAAEILADPNGNTAPAALQLIVVSDLQEGSHLEPLQGYEWPRGLRLSVENLNVGRRSNASLQRVPDPEENSPKSVSGVRVRVANNPDSRREQFQVGWAEADGHGFLGQPIPVYVPAGQSRVVIVPPPSSPAERLLLQGDEDEFDNTLFVVPPEPDHLKVLYLGSDSPKDSKQPLYFLQRAFQETRTRIVTVIQHAPESALTPEDIKDAALTIVADAPSAVSVSALREQAVAGNTVLFVVRSDATAAALAHVLDIPSLDAQEVRPPNYALLGEIDFRHPLFAPFADPRFSDFTKIHFWKYRKLDPGAIRGAHILARFDNGDPAFLEIPIGKGRVLALTSGWQPDDSQLGLSTKFVPMLYSILESSGVPASLPPQFQVGDSVPVAALVGNSQTPLEVHGPSGYQITLPAGETNFTQTLVPGVYSVGMASTKRFAVNLNPAESLTTPLTIDELERLGAPISPATPTTIVAERQARLANSELESRQKIWRWALVGAVVVLLLETWLGGRTTRLVPRPELSGLNGLNELNRPNS